MLIAIGDIHGEITKLKTLIDVLIEKDLVREKVVFLGDYIDRGENSVATLDYLIHLSETFPHFIFLRGNHEEMLLDAWKSEHKIGQDDVNAQISDNYLHEFRDKHGKVRLTSKRLSFLNKLKLSFRVGSLLFTHGGINKAGSINTWAYGLEGSLPKGVKRLIRGHVIQPYVTFYQDDIAIDTGAYQPDGFLSALVLDSTGYYHAPAVISVGERSNNIKKSAGKEFISTKRIRIQMWPHTNISDYWDLEETRVRYSGWKRNGKPFTDYELMNFLNRISSYAIYILEEKIFIDPIKRHK